VKLTVVIPITGEGLNDVRTEAGAWVAPGTEVEIRRVTRGVASIESEYDEALSAPGILAEVEAAAADGADGVFVTCFGDPAVHAAREVVDIPVVGGFEPAVLTALSLGEKVGIVTVLPNVVPMLNGIIRKYGLAERMAPIRVVDMPVLSLDEPDVLLDRLAEQAAEAVAQGEADVIVLGCTGMIGVAAALQERLGKDGVFVPVVDPTGAALLWLESSVRLGVHPSRTTYMPPPPKDRNP
jgi:allantoin racemase